MLTTTVCRTLFLRIYIPDLQSLQELDKVGHIIILYRKELAPREVKLLKVIQQAKSKTKIPIGYSKSEQDTSKTPKGY